MRLPKALLPAPESYGFILGLDMDGRVIHNLQDPSSKSYNVIISGQEHGGMLYLVSIAEDAIGCFPAP